MRSAGSERSGSGWGSFTTMTVRNQGSHAMVRVYHLDRGRGQTQVVVMTNSNH